MRKKIAAFIIVGALFAAGGAYFGYQRMQPATPQPNATAGLFEQSMPDAGGNLHPLSKWKGKTLVVNFWATWCPPCVEEMPELSQLQNELDKVNGQIIGIGIDSAANISQFASKYKITYPLYVSGMSGTELSRQFGNQAGGLPFTVLVAEDGRIKKTYLGRLNMEELRRDLGIL